MRDELMFPKEPKAAVDIALVELDGLVTKFEGKSFAIRAVAYSIDTTFFLAAYYGLSLIAGTAIGIAGLITGQEPVFADSTSTSCLNSFLTAVITLFYFSLFEGLYGATPGKLILGMRVVLDDGSPCTLRAGLTRGLWRYEIRLPATAANKPMRILFALF